MEPNRPVLICVADPAFDARAWEPLGASGRVQVRPFESGVALLDTAGSLGPGLIVLAGAAAEVLDACRRVQRSPRLGAVPVVVLGPCGDPQFVRQAADVGALDVLPLPFNHELMTLRLPSYLARSPGSVPLPGGFLVNESLRHDAVTGLPNRRQLLEKLDRLARRSVEAQTPLAVLGLAVDPQSEAQGSQTHGHQLWTAVAQTLETALRPNDLVARTAHDRFAVVLASPESETPECAAQNAREVARRLSQLLRAGVACADSRLTLDAATAFAVCPQDGRNGKELLRHLEQRLRKAEPDARRDRRAAKPSARTVPDLDLRLKDAIQNRRLLLYYQPKVDARTGEVVGAETLIRWPLRDGEYLEPGEFVPIAEAGGFIAALDDYVLSAACEQIAVWQQHERDFRIAVNLSAQRLHHRGIFDRLKELFATTGARAEHLELEITEGALISDFEAAGRWLSEVRQLGVTVALDDFGVGYSSLTYLRRLPLDTIKIDRSFVAGAEHDHNTLVIVRAIVAMGKALGMNVVAEGVETASQARLLTQLGCDALQGFLYSPAVPAGNFEAIMGNRRHSFSDLFDARTARSA